VARADVEPKTLRNRQNIANRLCALVFARHCLALPPAILKRPRQLRDRTIPDALRKRARAGTPAVVMKALLEKHKSMATWQAFQEGRGSVGVYKDKIIALERKLTRGLCVHVLPKLRAACLCPYPALRQYLALMDRDQMLHPGTYTASLNIFIDAAQIQAYFGVKAQALVIHMPQSRAPHQLATQLVLARWLGPDCSSRWHDVFRAMHLYVALEMVLREGMVQGGQARRRPLRLTCSPDWAALRVLLGWVGPGHECACPFCWTPRAVWKRVGYQVKAKRRLEDFDTPIGGLLRLFTSFEDLIYDPPHCIALLLTHIVIHALWFWIVQNDPFLQEGFTKLMRKHTQENGFVPDTNVKLGKGGWKVSNNLAKTLLFCDSFWKELSDFMPKSPQIALHTPWYCFRNPFQTYLRLFRHLAVQLIAWKPEGVASRQYDCKNLHFLFGILRLPNERWGVAAHVFIEHYTDRLYRHGSLCGMSSEGGEHTHQTVKKICEARPSFPRWKTPVGI
jgi:hypothetical protein